MSEATAEPVVMVDISAAEDPAPAPAATKREADDSGAASPAAKRTKVDDVEEKAAAAESEETLPVAEPPSEAEVKPEVDVPVVPQDADPATMSLISKLGPVDEIGEALVAKNGARGLATWSAATGAVIEARFGKGFWECMVLSIVGEDCMVQWICDGTEGPRSFSDMRLRAKSEGMLDGTWHACNILEEDDNKLKVKWSFNDSESWMHKDYVRPRGVWSGGPFPTPPPRKKQYRPRGDPALGRGWHMKPEPPKKVLDLIKSAGEPTAKNPEALKPTGAFAFLAQPVGLHTIPNVFDFLKEEPACTIS